MGNLLMPGLQRTLGFWVSLPEVPQRPLGNDAHEPLYHDPKMGSIDLALYWTLKRRRRFQNLGTAQRELNLPFMRYRRTVLTVIEAFQWVTS